MKEKKHEENMKEKIKKVAFALMAEKGLKDISMREIADACGVTKPVLYYYFKDKEDLCYSLIEESSIVNNDKLKKFVSTGAVLEDILAFIFSEYIIDVKRKEVLSFVVHVSSYLLSNPELEKRFVSMRKANMAIISDILEREYKAGRINKKGKDMAMHLIFANIAHLVLHSHGGDLKFWPSYPKDMAKAVLAAIDYKEK